MKKALDTLQRIQIGVGAVMLTIFLLAVVIQMGSRYLGLVATWTEDVSMYSFIWAAFMGAGAMVQILSNTFQHIFNIVNTIFSVIHEKKHFAFTSISDSIKNPKAKAALEIVIALVMLTFSVLMLVYGIQITKQFWNYKWTSIPSFNRGPVWMCVPICGGTSAIYLLGQLADSIKIIAKGEK